MGNKKEPRSVSEADKKTLFAVFILGFPSLILISLAQLPQSTYKFVVMGLVFVYQMTVLGNFAQETMHFRYNGD